VPETDGDRWPFTAYAAKDPLGFHPQPASPRRAWIEAMPHSFARRCLPLVVANQAGWVVPCPFGLRVTWDGTTAPGGLSIALADPDHPGRGRVADHFGSGILTFYLPYVFRTEPGVQLSVRGAPNFWIDGAHPLEGVIETEWASASFTMNWRIVAPGREVTFRAGDPICFLQPLHLGTIEAAEPAVVDLAVDPELEARHRRWAADRTEFQEDQDRPPTAWQKDYFLGRHRSGEPAPAHRTTVHVAPFDGAPRVEPHRLDHCYAQAAGLRIEERADGFVVHDRHGGEHELNHSAVFILECCTGDNFTFDVVEIVRGAYALAEDPTELVERCLADLQEAGLLVDVTA
jgi:hypothetical protein